MPKTIDVTAQGSELCTVSAATQSLGVSLRTVERYIQWAIASELSAFAGHRSGGPLNRHQQKILKVIRDCRALRLESFQIAQQVEALSLPMMISIEQVADWVRKVVPDKHAEDFVSKLYEDFGYEATEVS